MKDKGKCLCGGVSFEATVTDHGFHACHCSTCRAWSSSPLFAVAVEKIVFQGEDKISVYGSSEWAERGFCKDCGSSLFYHLKETDDYMICCGLFEDQSLFELKGEIYVDEQPGGYAFAGDHSRLSGAEFLASMNIE